MEESYSDDYLQTLDDNHIMEHLVIAGDDSLREVNEMLTASFGRFKESESLS